MFMKVVTDAIAKTPMAKRLLAEARLVADRKRADLCADLERTRAENERVVAPLRSKVEMAERKRDTTRLAFDKAGDDLRLAKEELLVASDSRHQAEVHLRSEIVELAPPDIAAFVRFLAAVESAVAGPLPASGRWERARQERAEVLDLLRRARKRADELEASSLASSKIVAELQKLRDQIDKVGHAQGWRAAREVEEAAHFERGPEAA